MNVVGTMSCPVCGYVPEIGGTLEVIVDSPIGPRAYRCPKCKCDSVVTEWTKAGVESAEEPTGVDHRSYNVGTSDYAQHKIQPWDIWLEYDLDPWRADIVKRTLRNKEGEDPISDLEKIKHDCDELIHQYKTGKQNI